MFELPNAAEQGLGDAIRRLGAKGFEGALQGWLRRCLAPDNLLILAYRDGARPQVLYRQTDLAQVFAELENTYVAGAYLLDPYHDLHRRRAPPGLYRLSDVAPDQFHRSRYFKSYYQQTSLLDELTYVVYPKPGVTVNICLGRDASSGQPFAPREVEAAARLAPVIVALAESHWRGLPADAGTEADLTGHLVAGAAQHLGIRLSQRQAEVALLILRGHSSVSIGLRLGLSAQTVKVFRKQLYRRCAISSQAELFALMMPLLKAHG